MQLMAHQIKGVEFLANNGGTGALFWEVGCGKTLGSLATYKYLRTKNPHLKLLIICPLSLIEGAWIKELAKFAPELTWFDLHGDNTNTRWIKKDSIPNCDIYIINFEYLISARKFEELALMIKMDGAYDEKWMCIIDESSKMKNHQAKTTERILELAKLFHHRVVMSGTPAPNIEWEYWAQMMFLNPEILGGSFHKFKNTCFALKRGTQVVPGMYMNKNALREMFKQGFKYQIKPDMRIKMLNRMKPWCDFVAARDCMDLPEEIDEYRIIEMNDEHRKAYNSMKENCVLELKESQSFAVANIVLTKFMKLRQITSGFIIDEFGSSIKLLKTNPKMEILKDIVEECGNEQIIVWGQFHCEIEEIVKTLEEYGGVSVLYGKTPQNERIDHVNNFINGTNRFLVAHPDSAAHGLTFTNCHIQIFYSLSYSYEEYSQARGRTMRYGQKNNCLYFHIMAKNSIDEDVLAIVQKKATAQEIAEKYLKG